MDKRHYSNLKSFAKKLVKKDIFKKIVSLEDKGEQVILFEYSIKSTLELKYAELRQKISDIEKKMNVFILITKSSLLKAKIDFFCATFYKEDFKKIVSLFKDIEKEMKNVRSI